MTQQFDIKKFNMLFEEQKTLEKQEAEILEEEDLANLNAEANKVPVIPYNQSIVETIIHMKNTIFFTVYDLFTGNYSNIFAGNKMYYIGLILIIFVIILFLYDSFTEA